MNPPGFLGSQPSFSGQVLPRELREAKAQEFINLKYGSMSVQEYELKFTQLSRYAPHMVADPRAQMTSAPSSASAPSPRFRQDQKGRALDSKSQGSTSGNMTFPTFPKCGKNPPGKCLVGRERCFGCGLSGHRLKDCPSARHGQGSNTNRAQSTSPAAPIGCPTK
ncbi:hypothetical protein MTR67_048230 [Solanum verrucosum]|uniref:CCHC-type domain-containing protein n=1 Tax=Solanum verrucosum TaxID=315347 RepID=A0AAF0ZZD0_SOLVR|nr:hypothetical protein MTR67_048230 [Solanum verrucosum]